MDLAPGARGPRAWGLVNFNGDVLRSENVTAITDLVGGAFCIDPGPGIDTNTAVMVVGEAFGLNGTSDANDNVAQVEWDSTPTQCPAGEMEVRTFIGDGSARTLGETDAGGFDLQFSNQGFAFVIP